MVISYDLYTLSIYNLERLLLTITPTNYVKLSTCTFEFLVFAYVEIPHFCDFPEGATVALSHRYVWENHKFQNVISYDIYMLSSKFGEVTLDVIT